MPPKFRKDLSDGSRREQQALLENSDDDDFFLRGPLVPNVSIANSASRDGRLNRVQGQVHEVVDIMQTNISKVMERGERLEDLQDKSDNLNASASAFRSKATTLQKSLWWKECKMRIFIGAFIAVVLIIILTAVIVQSKSKN